MPGWVSLRRAGVGVVLDARGPYLPRVVHWGADLGELADGEYLALPGVDGERHPRGSRSTSGSLTVSPTRADGWPGWPGLTGHRDGRASQPLFALDGVTHDAAGTGEVLRYRGVDAAAQLVLDGEFELTAAGVLRHRQTLTSTAPTGESPYVVGDLLSLLPVPEHVVEVLDHAGRWGKEAQVQRQPLHQGTWLRETRRGRTGPDSPLLLCVGAAGFNHRQSELWGVHLGWSGDQRHLVQRLNSGAVVLGAGEILGAGEVMLGPGESMTTPWTYFVYSDAGLDGAAHRLHAMLRSRPGHPSRPRPITLNTWEAVYFDQSHEQLTALADVAAELGVERFVVDDGWFGSRRDDHSGLGDWQVSPEVWPAGLGAMAEHVRALGMEFGLWFEPEMVNLDSDLARDHPDWVLGTPGRMPPEERHQQVLDLAHPDAYAHLVDVISTLVAELDIAYLKWDHNRDVADPVHRGGPRAGRPALRQQTLATYRLMAELRRRHPGLEIESCSSGGARIDLGVLEHTDRVWASDCIDPLERIGIVAGIATLLPFELIGSHVGSDRSHTTGRRHDLTFRLAVALFGHAGLEWDLTACPPDERARLAAWVTLAKEVRPLLRTGDLVRVDRPADPGTVLYGVVAGDRSEAVFSVARTDTSPRYGAASVRFAGLDPDRRYVVEHVVLGGPPVASERGTALTGHQLMTAGIPSPDLLPERAALLRLRG